MAEQLANDLQGQMQCVTFTLEEEVYGINVMQVQEVLREIEVAPVPGAPHYVNGIINLRGNLVSVIDARTRFGLPPRESTPMTRIIVIRRSSKLSVSWSTALPKWSISTCPKSKPRPMSATRKPRVTSTASSAVTKSC